MTVRDRAETAAARSLHVDLAGSSEEDVTQPVLLMKETVFAFPQTNKCDKRSSAHPYPLFSACFHVGDVAAQDYIMLTNSPETVKSFNTL